MDNELENVVEEVTETVEEKPKCPGCGDGERPEPPRDENGNIIAPPHGPRPGEDGERPEPPKDENGNIIEPPFGGPHGPRPPFGEKPEEAATEETVEEAAE